MDTKSELTLQCKLIFKTQIVDYQEKYQELLDRQDLFHEFEENGTDLSGAGDP